MASDIAALGASTALAVDGGAKLSLSVPARAKTNQSYSLTASGNSGDFKRLYMFIAFSKCSATAAAEKTVVGGFPGDYKLKAHKAFSKGFTNAAVTPGKRVLCAYLSPGSPSSEPQLRAGKNYNIKS